MSAFLFRLASGAVRRRRLVVVVWMALVVGAVTASAACSGPTSDSLRIPGAESQTANDLLAERFPEAAGSSAQLVFRAPAGSTLDDVDRRAEFDRAWRLSPRLDRILPDLDIEGQRLTHPTTTPEPHATQPIDLPAAP